jgi:hypothetical protein
VARLAAAGAVMVSVLVLVFRLHRMLMPKFLEAAIVLGLVSFDESMNRV